MSIERDRLTSALFPAGIPRLWCPLLTPFAGARRIDRARLGAHLRFLAPHVGGILVPGSTGEGWEMNDRQARALLAAVLGPARELGLHVLVGVLKFDAPAAVASIRETIEWIRERTGLDDPVRALAAAGVAGFTVCPPRGSTLRQREIESGLASILEMGAPLALYQLPQVTLNEFSPATARRLAKRFPNLILLKDTSGRDRIALSGVDLDGVCLVRGAEGGYARWTRAGSGPYDGLLLSTSNPFAPQYARLLRLLDRGKTAEAERLSARLEAVIEGAFAAVAPLPFGNAFTNANKALEHWIAWGRGGESAPAPRLISGARLPREVLDGCRQLLARHRLLPGRGYHSGGDQVGVRRATEALARSELQSRAGAERIRQRRNPGRKPKEHRQGDL